MHEDFPSTAVNKSPINASQHVHVRAAATVCRCLSVDLATYTEMCLSQWALWAFSRYFIWRKYHLQRHPLTPHELYVAAALG